MQTAYDSICFIYPDDGEGSRFDRMFPPLGLELVAAGVRDCVRERRMLDLRFERDWEHEVPAGTDLVALSMLWDKPVADILALVGRLKRLRPGVTVVAGGRVAEANRRALVTAPQAERVDVVFSGPDDGRFRGYVECGAPHRIPGVAWLQDGEYRETPMPPYGAIPDQPHPDRSLRRVRYRMIRRDGLDLGIESDTVQSSRGCSFKCSFCTFNRDQDGRPIHFTMRSAESVAEELAGINSSHVIFVDDNVAQDVERIDRLCDLLLARGIRKTYGIETRINLGLRPKVAEKMARAGFRHITFGLEAIHDHTLKFLNKGFRRHTIEQAFAAIRGLPMVYTGNFIVGSVGETRAQMLEIPEFARRIGLDTIMVNHLRCRGPEPLTQTVMATPGYHIDPATRKVYSDAYGLEEIAAIIRRIKRDFWTPAQRLKTAWKVRRLFPSVRYSALARHWLAWRLNARPDPWGRRAQ
jgi:magnesium-protoporphyrin IX monomethyl ester (oxidative) cyclase